MSDRKVRLSFPALLPGHGPGGWSGLRLAIVLCGAALFMGLWLLPGLAELRLSTQRFPVWLHTAAESFSIIVSTMVFAVAWHAYRPDRASNVIVLACGFLAAALLDFGHMMSYQGMPDFITPASAQKTIAFWLPSRLLSALSFLWVVFRAWEPFDRPGSRYAWLGGTLACVAAVYVLQLFAPQVWPVFFVSGQGMTPLKLASEGAVAAIMLVVVVRLLVLRSRRPPFYVDGLLVASALLILSELSLMSYRNINDTFSLVGHVYKVVAYFFIYRLMFVVSVREPYDLLAMEMAQKKAAERQVQALAFRDPLTGLANKVLLRQRVEAFLVAQDDVAPPAALLLLTLDGLKQINDSLGHAAGDEVLRTIADRLGSCAPDAEGVARLGGDEFAVFLPGVASADAVAQFHERLFNEVARPMPMPASGDPLRITVSVGVALAPCDGRSFDALFQHADIALHQSKAAGGNALRYYDPAMNRAVSQRLSLRNGLRHALEEHHFVLHYQPQFSLADGRLVGVEALLRWNHPERGMVPPLQFIPEAEASGLIVPIGTWVIDESCRQAAVWWAMGLGVPVVAVNLSAKQFQRGDIRLDVEQALARWSLPAHALELELTESILVQDAPLVLETVRRLRAMGVRLSIDDFGTGYSSLAYLRDFPADKLKVDQSFVRDLTARPDGGVIVATIVQMARALGLETIAEGVEDQQTVDALIALGCDEAQGYHFARPMPAAELEVFLDSRRRSEGMPHPA